MTPKVLIQLDPDPQPSTFDAIVAIDAGVDHLLRHHAVSVEEVRDLVYGGLFTRSPDDLKSTAMFIGGTDAEAAEALLKATLETFFEPFRLSVLIDPNGANTTAAAAVLAARNGLGGSLEGVHAAVLAGTGPVGQRVARLLGREQAIVKLASRKLERARAAAGRIGALTGLEPEPIAPADDQELQSALRDVRVVIAAGPPGACLMSADVRRRLPELRAVIDLNAVPPLGIEGVESQDRGTDRDGNRAWGAIGVGGTKMRIHAEAIRRLFTRNDLVIDAEEALAIGAELQG